MIKMIYSLIFIILFQYSYVIAYPINYEDYNDHYDTINNFLKQNYNNNHWNCINQKDHIIINFPIYDIQCNIISLENLSNSLHQLPDFSIKSGEIVIPMFSIEFDNQEDSNIIALLPYNNQLVSYNTKKNSKKIIQFLQYNYNKESFTYLEKLSKEEISLSIYLHYPTYRKIEERDEFINFLLYIEPLINNLEDSNNYKVYHCQYYSNKNYIHSINEIPGKSINNLYLLSTLSYIDNLMPENYIDLAVDIANDNNLTYYYKKPGLNILLYYYSDNLDIDNNKEKYFEHIIKLVQDYPNEKLGGYEHNSEIDQDAIKNLLENYRRQKISIEDLFEMSNEILKFQHNPAVSMYAYCGIMEYNLQNNNIAGAFKLAVDIIEKYPDKIIWSYYKGYRYLNAMPIIMFLDHFLANEINSEEYIKYIQQLINISPNNKHFQTYLYYRIAQAKEYYSYPLEDVIEAYDLIPDVHEKDYIFCPPSGPELRNFYSFRIHEYIITKLKSMKKYSLLTKKDSLRVKKFILAKKESNIVVPKNYEVIIQQETPYFLLKNKEYFWWFKGEIDGEIYWVHTADLK